jgi:hypothetical protein
MSLKLRSNKVSSIGLNPEDGASNTIAPENQNSNGVAESEQTDIKLEVAQVPIPIEEAPGIAKQVTRFEDGAEPEEREAANSWAWLYPDDTYGNESVSPQASAAQPAAQSQPNVSVTSQSPGVMPMNASGLTSCWRLQSTTFAG